MELPDSEAPLSTCLPFFSLAPSAKITVFFGLCKTKTKNILFSSFGGLYGGLSSVSYLCFEGL